MKLPETPKTMREAIINGLKASGSYSYGYDTDKIQIHVADFIRQKLTPIYGRATMEGNQDVIDALEELQKKLGI